MTSPTLTAKQQKSLKTFYHPGMYTFNVNPDDSMQCLTAPKDNVTDPNRLDRFTKKYKKIYDELFVNTNICVYLQVEISEPRVMNKGQFPRLHFHGWIDFPDYDDILYFLMNILPVLTRCNQIEIDTFDNAIMRDMYCHKAIGKFNLPHYCNMSLQTRNSILLKAIKQQEAEAKASAEVTSSPDMSGAIDKVRPLTEATVQTVPKCGITATFNNSPSSPGRNLTQTNINHKQTRNFKNSIKRKTISLNIEQLCHTAKRGTRRRKRKTTKKGTLITTQNKPSRPPGNSDSQEQVVVSFDT